MLNLIKSDLFRIFKGKTIYVIAIIIILISLISIFSLQPGHMGLSVNSTAEENESLSEASGIEEYRSIMKQGKGFPLDMKILGQNMNLYYFFIVLVFIVIVTDFSNSSIKNTLSSAITRKKYYFAKLILVFGLVTGVVIFNNYFMYGINYLLNGAKFTTGFITFTKTMLIQLPLLYGISSLLVAIAFVTRKNTAYNAIAIPFVMVVQLICFAIINLFKINGDWFNNYEIQYALANLVSNPSMEYIMKCTLLGFIYVLLFNVIGYYSFKKAEIK